jgi:hypothetical protein
VPDRPADHAPLAHLHPVYSSSRVSATGGSAASSRSSAISSPRPVLAGNPSARRRAASHTSVSQQPRQPQWHFRPSGRTIMCPNSPR